MSVQLTVRMKNWFEQLGVHVAVAGLDGYPRVIVAPACRVDNGTVIVPLTEAQQNFIKDLVGQNPKVAIGPGQLGVVRAPYQLKGNGLIEGNNLVVRIDEIYCTKPGAEAGIRLDTMGFETMREFDESRWKDLEPPRAD